MNELFHYIGQHIYLDSYLKLRLTLAFRYQELPKGTSLLAAGHICNRIWFLQQGMTRSFLRTEDGEVTTWIHLPLTIIYAGNSFAQRVTSEQSIQTLERSNIWYITRDDLEDVITEFPSARELYQKISAQYVSQITSHSNMKGLSALDQRFHWLNTHFPDIVYQADPSILASFIRVSRRSFYNLKKKLGSR